MQNGRVVGLVAAAALVGGGLGATGGAQLTNRGDGSATGGGRARSVILVVGDGMAAVHREAARLALSPDGAPLEMDRLPVLGLQTTIPLDPADPVTDSAAAATAWATGVRTVRGAVSVDEDGEALLPLGVEAAAAGRATGLVTTSTVTDATAAAFFASVRDREDETAIAAQYLERARPDVVLGGGEDVWRSGDDDLLSAARDAGYEVVDDPGGLRDADDGRLLGLFADDALYEEEAAEVTLAGLTRAALDRLDDADEGFLLLVEEEGIDAASHDRDGARMLQAMESLEAAVAVVRDYTEDHPDTLLVVTGDHETGGLAVEDWDGGTEDGPFDVAADRRQFALDWTTGGHTAVPTPVTAIGPGSGALSGHYPNTHLHAVLRTALLGA